MFPWRDTPATTAFAVGDAIYSGGCRGTVVAVDADKATMGIAWSDGDDSAITYPMDTDYLRRAWPWEL